MTRSPKAPLGPAAAELTVGELKGSNDNVNAEISVSGTCLTRYCQGWCNELRVHTMVA